MASSSAIFSISCEKMLDFVTTCFTSYDFWRSRPSLNMIISVEIDISVSRAPAHDRVNLYI